MAAQCSKEKGAAGLAECCMTIFRALSEYCLQTDTAYRHRGPDCRAGGAAVCPERAARQTCLPAADGVHGAVDEIRAELDALVGLAAVKDYVFGLADNLQVQQRRAPAGSRRPACPCT